tara:strand:+ start:772 stop:2706 length:1935 start_codon:yes stop_codon:yes gene_type:complete
MGVFMMKKTILGLILVLLFSVGLAAAAGDLTMSIDSASLSGNPGDTVTFTLTLTNNGASEMSTVAITSTDLVSGGNTITAPTISTVTGLAAGVTTTVSYDVVIPTTPAGTYSGSVTATDQVDNANTETLSYAVVVNSEDEITLDPTSLGLEERAGESDSVDLTVTNTGSTTLTSWTITFESADADDDAGKLQDDDEDEITLTFSGTPTSLDPGASATVSVTADIDEDIDFNEDYDGTVTVAATGVASVSTTATLTVDVLADICEDGKQGNSFTIDIEDPSSGDEYTPGETIMIEVDVENDDNEELEVKVEAILYNLDEGKKEETVRSDEVDIDDGDSETFNLELDIPSDVDDGDTFYLYVKAYESGNEDDNCDYERIRIDIERAEDDVEIDDVSVNPSSGLACGDIFTMSVEVVNVGTDEQDDVYIEIYDSELDILAYSDNFDLGDHNDNDNDYKYTTTFTVPEDLTSGTYYSEVTVDFGSDEVSEMFPITLGVCDEIEGGSSSSSSSSDSDLKVTLNENIEIEDGTSLTIPLLIENEGSGDVELDLDVATVTWADLEGTEYLATLSPGVTTHAYIYLDLEEGTFGEHDLVVSVNDVEKIITIDFGDEPVTSAGFDWTSNWLWIVIDVILVVLALLLLIGLARR